MNVLIVTNMFPCRNPAAIHSGIFIKEQAEALVECGVSVRYIHIDGFKSKLEYLKSIFTINLFLIKHANRFDVIHIHYGLSGLFLLFNFLGIKNKTILTLHGSDISETSKKFIQRFISKTVAKKAKAVIVVNKDFHLNVSALNTSTSLIPCGVDATFFKPINTEFDKTIVFPSSPKREEKNFPLFKEVFNLIEEKLPGYSYRCLDNMTRDEIRDQLQSATLLIMTSKYEGSPQVIKEALACNLPVISTPVGDVKMLLEKAKHCYISNTHSAVELADLAEKVICANARASNGHDIISELGLNNQLIAQKLLSVYTVVASHE